MILRVLMRDRIGAQQANRHIGRTNIRTHENEYGRTNKLMCRGCFAPNMYVIILFFYPSLKSCSMMSCVQLLLVSDSLATFSGIYSTAKEFI